ncbi:hypothetical protein BDY21DRAFT_342242 [Lineolata rhizophorae]|uniref:Rhodopsin domain-containing protein n=1 Tax=Lineolata rhizophorae TaxID=578093 RepID=A0A6A6P2U5_9PEZI|nr:hypothetical protein BDY21DRAFT_342242 [Lineolata rhizophorae]
MPVSDRGWSLAIWMVVFTILTSLTMGLRFVALRVQRRSFRVDDYLIIGAFVNLIVLEVTSWWAIANGLGAPVMTLTPYQASVQLKLLLSAGMTWTFATVLCKLAVLWMYTHIFTVRPFKIAAYVTMGFVTSYAIIFVPIFFTHCIPIEASWSVDPVVQATQCRPIKRQEYASVSINMALDLAVVLLPLPVIWKLQIPTRKKIFVSFMFSLGLIIVAIMAWRIQSTVAASNQPDWNIALYTTALQSHLEVWLGIIAANLPTLAPLFSRFIKPTMKSYFNNFKWSSNNGGGSGGDGGKQYRNSHNMAIRTFGSGGPDLKAERFNRLAGSSGDFSDDLMDRYNLNKVEVCASSRPTSPDAIAMRRDFEVGIEAYDQRPRGVHEAV